MSEEQNIAIMRRYYDEIVNQNNLAVAEEIFTSEYTSHFNESTNLPPGPPGVKAFISANRQGFPDLQVTVDQIFAEGDQVASRWTLQGTHTGEWFGIPATGKQAKWTGVVITRFADGKIAEDWYSYDQLGLLVQLGIVSA